MWNSNIEGTLVYLYAKKMEDEEKLIRLYVTIFMYANNDIFKTDLCMWSKIDLIECMQ